MKACRRHLWAVIFSILLFSFACVTINIYFPAEKVEAVADEIVHEIRKKSGEQENPSKEKDSFLREILVAFACPVAWADDVTSVTNPTIRAMKERMIRRHTEWKSYYKRGLLKEGSDGYVSIKSTKGLLLKEKRDLRRLVEAENKDRKKLYEAVAGALKIDPSQVSRVAKIFAGKWQEADE